MPDLEVSDGGAPGEALDLAGLNFQSPKNPLSMALADWAWTAPTLNQLNKNPATTTKDHLHIENIVSVSKNRLKMTLCW